MTWGSRVTGVADHVDVAGGVDPHVAGVVVLVAAAATGEGGDEHGVDDQRQGVVVGAETEPHSAAGHVVDAVDGATGTVDHLVHDRTPLGGRAAVGHCQVKVTVPGYLHVPGAGEGQPDGTGVGAGGHPQVVLDRVANAVPDLVDPRVDAAGGDLGVVGHRGLPLGLVGAAEAVRDRCHGLKALHDRGRVGSDQAHAHVPVAGRQHRLGRREEEAGWLGAEAAHERDALVGLSLVRLEGVVAPRTTSMPGWQRALMWIGVVIALRGTGAFLNTRLRR